MIRRILVLVLCISSLLSYSQGLLFNDEVTADKVDGRFTATLNHVPVVYKQDPHDLMKEFSLQLQWWSLMAEPIEYYTVKWESTGHFVLGDKTYTRKQLSKYPDLLKRFDILQPYKMEIRIQGSAEAGVVTVKRGKGYNNFGFDVWYSDSFKKKGQAYDRHYLKGNFTYIVEDGKLLTTKAGKLGEGLVPDSPHWNEFLYWNSRYDKNKYAKGDKNDKALQQRNAAKFKRLSKISLKGFLHKLEWNTTELRAIAQLYEKYESGELKPSPKEIVRKKTEKELKKLKQYNKNDFWTKLEKPKRPYVEIFKQGKLYGLRYKNSNSILVPPKYPRLRRVGDYYVARFDTRWEREIPVPEKNYSILIDETGKQVLPYKFNYIKCHNESDPRKSKKRYSVRIVMYKIGTCEIAKGWNPSKDGWQKVQARGYYLDGFLNEISSSTYKKPHKFSCKTK